MKRQVSLEDISDGRLYRRHDMVRISCGGCRGCSLCCHGMGKSAILDPMDACRLSEGTGLQFGALLSDKIELNVVDGIILPNLNMSGENETCGFLNEQGRCSIHPYRPGVCRLFPLGRYYEEDPDAPASAGGKTFRYFVQTSECPAPNKTKIRIEKWIGLPDLPQYEEAVLSWHSFLESAENCVAQEKDDARIKNMNLYILEFFFLKAFDPDRDFYPQFADRLAEARTVLDLSPTE